MELNLSTFFRAIGIHIFDTVELGDILNDRDDSLKIISLDKVDDFLWEELRYSWVDLASKFGVLFELFLHLRGKEVNEELCVAVLDRDFHNLFSPVNDLYDAIELSDVEILSIK